MGCDGYYETLDFEDSNALCADQSTCEYLCDNIEECESIDMHQTNSRCFLNPRSASTHVDVLRPDRAYMVLVQRDDPNAEHPLGIALPMERGPVLVAGLDHGASWSKLLRFPNITFSSAGTFKLCFCDSTILPTGKNSCRDVSDYAIEVGTMHSSGVSCLIQEPSLRRASCVEQYYGGLRCYEGTAPSPEVAVWYPRT